MCTVTYLPLGKDAFLLTSNRDESKIRPTHPPSVDSSGGIKLLYPKDTMAGGTWVCLSERNRTACLMNGGFEKHEWKPPYRKSRGLVMLDMFRTEPLDDFFTKYNFEGIEPFTLIIYDELKMFEFRWDGLKPHVKPLDTAKPQIWSSATLYPKPVRQKREAWFEKWLEGRAEFKQEDIVHFHRFGGEGDPENDFVMNRFDIVQTVSITSIAKTPVSAHMQYNDLVENRTTTTHLELNRERAAGAQ